jgi:hypothetical protein
MHFDRELNGWERIALDWIVEECKRNGQELKEIWLVQEGRFIRVLAVRGLPKDEGTFGEAKRQSARLWIGSKGTIYAEGLRNPRHRRVIKKLKLEEEFK